MRIGIDFDNTIICYDAVFRQLARQFKLVGDDYCGSKLDLREMLLSQPAGDLSWQRLQGKAYGEGIGYANIFPGVKEFIASCNADENIEIFIVSHKTELGHFDEKRINLRDAARGWLREQGFFDGHIPFIKPEHIFFASTREAKIDRIKSLHCTHFIDDLPEVLFAPQFPQTVQRFLFQPDEGVTLADEHDAKVFTNWTDIKNAIFAT